MPLVFTADETHLWTQTFRSNLTAVKDKVLLLSVQPEAAEIDIPGFAQSISCLRWNNIFSENRLSVTVS